MKKLKCATYEGLDAKVVDVELTLTKGLPSFSIVGSATALTSAGSNERIKSALLSNEYKFPPKRITINLAPSDDFKKSGSQFDLSIALLIAMAESEADFSEWFVFGELGLDGEVKENRQLYALILSLANQNLIQKAVVPKAALQKLSKIPYIDFYGVDSLREAKELFENIEHTKPHTKSASLEYDFYEIDGIKYYYQKSYPEDFIAVKGQEVAKRAALIAAAGFHNILLEGSPGCGKSMIASRLRYILPPMTNEEILEVAKLQTLNMQEPDFKPLRPFIASHATSTPASIFGGGQGKIGEIGLANKGILFFDELPHFSAKVLESLREPLQENRIRIGRINQRLVYETNFLFVAAMNPCPCGNLLDETKECRCNELEIQRYKNRLSDPFLDRIDLNVVMQNVSSSDKPSLSSKEMHKEVVRAHIFAKERGQKNFNGKMSDAEIEEFCVMSDAAAEVLDMAVQRFALSFRSIKKVQKVARTIADLAESKLIEKEHLLEALSYRRR
ncbi:MAG: YifB family Mg chelatase-like AAA ATPase [Sulfurimonas sp.]